MIHTDTQYNQAEINMLNLRMRTSALVGKQIVAVTELNDDGSFFILLDNGQRLKCRFKMRHEK